MRSDIYWAARRWRESSEQIELYYGDRWRDFTPLNAVEKADIIRAVVGYALAEDKIGLARFREKYAPLMSGEADKRAFDTIAKLFPKREVIQLPAIELAYGGGGIHSICLPQPVGTAASALPDPVPETPES